MRNRTTTRPTIEHLGDPESTGMDREVFTISDAALGHITDMLSTFYQSGAYGCMREQISNGWDAALEAEVEPRIELTLSRNLDDTLQVVIKDNGCGMSRIHFRRYYCGYGETSKLHSENAAGMFGVGAKSWLALSDSATVVTVDMNGEKTVAIISQDDDGRVVADIPPSTQTDPSEHGTTVTIPLRDRNQRAEVSKAIHRAAFAYPPNSVFLNGEALIALDEVEGTIHAGSMYFIEPTKRQEFGLNAMNVLQDGIIYPVDPEWGFDSDSMLTTHHLLESQSNWMKRWYTAGVIMEVPHDTLLPNPQRDGLRDTRRNRKTLSEKFAETLEASVNARQAYYDSLAWGNAMTEHVHFMDVFEHLTDDAFTWRGKSISTKLDLKDADIPLYVKSTGERACKADELTAAALPNLVVYRGFTADDLRKRKFVYHFNTVMRPYYRQDMLFFVLLPEGDTEGFEHEWISVGKDDSPQYRECTREEVFAYAARERSQNTQTSTPTPTLYDMYDFDSEGAMTMRRVSLKDVPTDVIFTSMREFSTHAEVMAEDGMLKDTTILGLRPRQQVYTFCQRRPNAVTFDPAILYAEKIENELMREDMQDFFAYRSAWAPSRWVANGKCAAIVERLPDESSFKKTVQKVKNIRENLSQYTQENNQWRRRSLFLPRVREELGKPRPSISEWINESYPLVSYAADQVAHQRDTNLLEEHIIEYINMVENKEN